MLTPELTEHEQAMVNLLCVDPTIPWKIIGSERVIDEMDLYNHDLLSKAIKDMPHLFSMVSGAGDRVRLKYERK